MTLAYKPIKFPLDEGAHECNVEWWYYNGLLTSDVGDHYGFMACLFKIDNKKVKIPYLNKLPFKKLCFFHSIITDIKAQKSYPISIPISVLSADSFSKDDLFINFINYTKPILTGGFVVNQIEEIKPFEYRLKTEQLDLNLKSKKPPLLEGGNGFLKLHSKDTYYYSLTDLETSGEIIINKKRIKITGKSWFDHQWADTSYTKDKWNWFSIQLNNKMELVVFEYDDGIVKDRLASIVHPDGHQTHYQNIILEPVGEVWQSPKTKAKYPVSWKIEVPEEDISLITMPLVKTQEVIFGEINYWEGPLEVKGDVKGNKVLGQGFMELVGRPAENSFAINFIKDTLKKIKI